MYLPPQAECQLRHHHLTVVHNLRLMHHHRTHPQKRRLLQYLPRLSPPQRKLPDPKFPMLMIRLFL